MDRAMSISAVKKYIVKPINEFKMNELVEELKAA